jgi:hypothetical protein
MSKCPEYFDLHESYVEALRKWSEACLLKGEPECQASGEVRDLAFRKVSHHWETCARCNKEAPKGPKR